MDRSKQQASNRKKMVGVYQFKFSNGKYVGYHISIRQAERDTGVKASDISLCCRGKVKHAGKFIWVRAEDYL